MQKIGKTFELGSYELELYPEETSAGYGAFTLPEEEDPALRIFHTLLPTGDKKSLDFLKGLGIDPQKITCARPLSEPDETGEVLFLCAAPLCATLKKGGDTSPRQSEEEAGISMVFVGDEREFHKGAAPHFSQQVEMRFVIPLTFDPALFFET